MIDRKLDIFVCYKIENKIKQKVNIANNVGICYTMPRQKMRLVSKLAQSETPRMAVRGVFIRLIVTAISV